MVNGGQPYGKRHNGNVTIGTDSACSEDSAGIHGCDGATPSRVSVDTLFSVGNQPSHGKDRYAESSYNDQDLKSGEDVS